MAIGTDVIVESSLSSYDYIKQKVLLKAQFSLKV
jgi:hypothetical protein